VWAGCCPTWAGRLPDSRSTPSWANRPTALGRLPVAQLTPAPPAPPWAGSRPPLLLGRLPAHPGHQLPGRLATLGHPMPGPAGARSLPPAGGNTRPRHDRPAAGSPLRSESPTTPLRPAPPSIIGRHPCRLFLQQPRPAATCTTLPAAPSPSPAGQDQGQERQGQPEPKDTPSCIPSYR
jgi:hypothetical protein